MILKGIEESEPLIELNLSYRRPTTATYRLSALSSLYLSTLYSVSTSIYCFLALVSSLILSRFNLVRYHFYDSLKFIKNNSTRYSYAVLQHMFSVDYKLYGLTASQGAICCSTTCTLTGRLLEYHIDLYSGWAFAHCLNIDCQLLRVTPEVEPW